MYNRKEGSFRFSYSNIYYYVDSISHYKQKIKKQFKIIISFIALSLS